MEHTNKIIYANNLIISFHEFIKGGEDHKVDISEFLNSHKKSLGEIQIKN